MHQETFTQVRRSFLQLYSLQISSSMHVLRSADLMWFGPQFFQSMKTRARSVGLLNSQDFPNEVNILFMITLRTLSLMTFKCHITSLRCQFNTHTGDRNIVSISCNRRAFVCRQYVWLALEHTTTCRTLRNAVCVMDIQH